MLLEFSMRNFYSFKEGATVSFRLDANCPQYISHGLPYTPVLCIKGANASGKTNLLKAIAFLLHFCTRSFASEPDDSNFVAPYFDSEDPCEFSVTFQVDAACYEYELELTNDAIVRETIYRTKTKKTKIIERNGNTIAYVTKEFAGLSKMNLRNNASLVSTARQYAFEELSDVYGFFAKGYSNVGYLGLRENPLQLNTICKILRDHDDVLDFTKTFIADCDTGIHDIKILEREDEGKKVYFPVFYHKKDETLHPVIAISESSGTKTLFRSLGLYKGVLDVGGVLVLDEFDINLHPHILPKLINLFLDAEINTRGAQLIFSTHNTEIMDLLGRYRTYLVNKDDNESYTYRLDEISGNLIRNDRPISPTYNEGKIGGVPKL
ncbi:MAG: ATP-binding protein [Betaproteobacteria bacterium]|nr:ATP-binding protein [Betaproteobacteria bacterium]